MMRQRSLLVSTFTLVIALATGSIGCDGGSSTTTSNASSSSSSSSSSGNGGDGGSGGGQGGGGEGGGSCTPTPEKCDGIDNDCDGVIDNGDPESGANCNTGLMGVCDAGTTACEKGVVVCNGNVQPGAEECDGLDNDCDGTVDNGNPGGGMDCSTGNQGICDPGTTACENGMVVCNQNEQAGTEACDGVDNDCDGAIDNGDPGAGMTCSTGLMGVCDAGTTACTAGSIVCNQNTQSSAETCDGLDNDCNGAVDDGNPGGGMACNTGKSGVCAAGTSACTGGMIVCNQNTQSSAEICDGLDNDCNGAVDNGNPGGGMACNTGKLGICAAGISACTGGVIACNQNMQPAAEACDGLDNDCDGVVDNGNPGGGMACNTGKLGICAAGTSACTGGMVACNQNMQSTAEICDGLDNDCNGVVDDGNPGGGANCNTGLPGVCSAGTTSCTGGAISCTQNTQSSGETCDGIDNDCDGTVDETVGTGATGTCVHNMCQSTGGKLDASCDPCVATVCAADSYCCTTNWDSVCVGEVATECGLQCDWGTCQTGQLGVCGDGNNVCTGGNLSCSAPAPDVEVCDDLDNDCNGVVDDNPNDAGKTCTTTYSGACAAGTTQCNSGTLDCVPNIAPVPEVCGDGVDNSCDDVIDEFCACAHSGCDASTGVPLTASCDPCVAAVCAADSFCCTTDWDNFCVGEVADYCTVICP